MTSEDLLSQAANAQAAGASQAEIQALALSCHARMLEIAEKDKPFAVRHALAGAELLSGIAALGGVLPDWLVIHEEQCCRYGCTWIHELLIAGDRGAGIWVSDALRLLSRMEQLHADPVDWAPMVRASLLNHASVSSATPRGLGDLDVAPSVSTSNKGNPRLSGYPRIVVVGNCQCHPLMLALRKALPQAPIHFCPSVHLATEKDVAKLHQRLTAADLLVVHRIQPGYRNDIGLDTATLRSHLPASAQAIILPNLHYEGPYPFIAYALDPDGQLAALESESPLGSYHDFLAMAAASDGLPVEVLLQRPNEELINHIRQAHRQSIQELQLREQDCDIAMSDWIDLNHQQMPLMHTINHPTQDCLDQILRRLVRRIASQQSLQANLYDRQEHLGACSIPIHPWVHQALELGAWARSWGQRQGEPFTIEQQLQESIRFYQLHPWIIQHNLHHPKFEQAQSLLSNLQKQVPADQSSPSMARRRQPSLAALINYYDDIEMLAWQLRSGGLDIYDRIYIWDGPYQYRDQLGLGESAAVPLAETPLGQQLLADPRVVYRHGNWTDEAIKRIEAYAAIEEDVIILVDTDEFFRLDRNMIDNFWSSGHGVGSHRIQNLYAGGLLGSDAHHRSATPETLPEKRIIFRRDRIAPAQHLDYLWLVGVAQNPTDPAQLFPQPLGDTLHLTGCRSTRGQIGKMSFYKCLALKDRPTDPVLTTLRTMIAAKEISSEEALMLYLRGDPGFAGLPHPDFGLSLQPRFPDPRFPSTALDAILADSHRASTGEFTLLEGYPLVLWFPGASAVTPIQISCSSPQTVSIRSWVWLNRQPALESPSLQVRSEGIQLGMPSHPDLMGMLLQIRIEASSFSPRCHTLSVHQA
jgi:hypothetical protein